MASFPSAPSRCKVLVVDDEPDILAVTKLGLKSLRWQGRRITFLAAASGTEAIEVMRANPDVAVVLLDVVMETEHAGLDCCRAIRSQLDNQITRVLLRTGQPGHAPEKQTIEDYDIDGYLPKAELTSTRLYSACRTAIRAWEQLLTLERHRQFLTAVNDCAVSLRTYQKLDVSLNKILDTAIAICPSSLAILSLETYEEDGNPRRFVLHESVGEDAAASEAKAAEWANKIHRDAKLQSLETVTRVDGGVLLPIRLHRELGYGWIFLVDAQVDELVLSVLPMLSAHAANALYGSVAQAMLSKPERNIFDDIAI